MRPIDADVVLEKMENAYSFSDKRGQLAYAISCVKDAPTLEVAKMLDEESLKVAHEACERNAVRIIDANLLLAVARDMQSETEETAYNFLNNAQNPSTEWECVEDLIENAPTLKFAFVVHAHWIEESYEYYNAWQEAFGTENFFNHCEHFTDHIACSNCLKSYNIMDNGSAGCWKFCPNCGAKME